MRDVCFVTICGVLHLMLTLGVSFEQANMVLNLEIYTLGIISIISGQEFSLDY